MKRHILNRICTKVDKYTKTTEAILNYTKVDFNKDNDIIYSLEGVTYFKFNII